jgi:hypothetical protein
VGGYKRGTAIVLSIRPDEFIQEVLLGEKVAPAVYREIFLRTAALKIPCRRL